jgi:hypothetical protein
MADSLHMALSNFRETMLTAIARLEFQLRDSKSYTHMASSTNSSSSSSPSLVSLSPNMDKFEHTLGEILNRLEKLEVKNSQIPIVSSLPTNTNLCELLKMESPSFTKNLLIPSVKSTPALSAAVAAVTSSRLTDFTLESSSNNKNDEDVILVSEEEDDAEEQEVDTEMEEDDEEEKEEEESLLSEGEVEEDNESSPELKQIVVKNKQYYMGSNNSVYLETDEGYEQIGMYNSEKDEVNLFGEESEEEVEVEEEEVEEEEEDAVEVEDFVFKGKTYQIDSEKNIYLDGEHIGVWNGKKIVALDV